MEANEAMKADLIERLRAVRAVPGWSHPDAAPNPLCTEAADELTALRERVAALEGALSEARDQLWHLAKDPRTNPLIKELTHLLTPESDNG